MGWTQIHLYRVFKVKWTKLWGEEVRIFMSPEGRVHTIINMQDRGDMAALHSSSSRWCLQKSERCRRLRKLQTGRVCHRVRGRARKKVKHHEWVGPLEASRPQAIEISAWSSLRGRFYSGGTEGERFFCVSVCQRQVALTPLCQLLFLTDPQLRPSNFVHLNDTLSLTCSDSVKRQKSTVEADSSV